MFNKKKKIIGDVWIPIVFSRTSHPISVTNRPHAITSTDGGSERGEAGSICSVVGDIILDNVRIPVE